MITVRVAREEDAAPLLRIYSHYVSDTAITFEREPPSLDEFKQRIRKTLENYPYLVAEDDGNIVGYIYASRFRERAAYDWAAKTSIYIDGRYHRKGIGRMLYEKMEDILRRQNVTNVYATIVEPVGDSDEYLTGESTLFHEAMGYRRVAEYHGCANKFGRWYNLVETEKTIAERPEVPDDFIPFSEMNV